MAILSITNRMMAFEDESASNNPRQRPFDWSRQMEGLVVENPSCIPFTIPSLQTVSLFSGIRTTSHAADSQYALSVVNTATNRYRLKWTGVGTNPAFRTLRTVTWPSVIAPDTNTITFTVQLNQSVVVTTNAGSIFGSVVEGDIVYIPGVSTGDSVSVFNTLNEGYWIVLSATATSLVITRDTNEVFSALTETVIITSGASFQVFSVLGVQIDDLLQLSSTFPTVTRNTYEIVSVTCDTIEFVSGITLPPITTIVPGLTSLVVYSEAKSFIYIETNQNISLIINGSATGVDVEPILAGDPNKVGTFQLTGNVFQLSIINKSTQAAKIKLLQAE
jgi:hypothetical protein